MSNSPQIVQDLAVITGMSEAEVSAGSGPTAGLTCQEQLSLSLQLNGLLLTALLDAITAKANQIRENQESEDPGDAGTVETDPILGDSPRA